ncbi:MAG: DUF423 domain-containing protein [Halioglobus sp.]
MAKLFIVLGSFSCMLGVMLGAFGAHALKSRLGENAMGIFETAVQYQFYHSLALLAVGILALSQPQTILLKSSGYLFLLGIIIFSGSLYLLSFTGVKWLGAITPLGGLAFIGGWACLAFASWKMTI